MAVYRCRLCDLSYHHNMDVIGIFSEEGKASNIAAKILLTLTVMVVENDPTPQYICRVCWGQVDCNARFFAKCHATNEKLMKGLLAKPTNLQYKEENLKLLKMPIHLLFKFNKDPQVVYEALIKHMKNKTSQNNRSVFEVGPLNLRQINKNANNSVPGNSDATNVDIANFCQSSMSEVSDLLTKKLNVDTNRVYSENNAAIANGMSPNSLINGNTASFKTYSKSALKNKLKSRIDSASRISMNNYGRKTVTNVDKNQLRFVKSAHQLNASVPNTLRRTNNVQNCGALNKPKSSSNGINNNDEVICLDDDDDDDVNDKNDHSCVQNNIYVNKWINTNNNNNNNIGLAANVSKDHLYCSPINSTEFSPLQRQPTAIPVIEKHYSLQSPSSSSNNSVGVTTVQNFPPRSTSRSSSYSTEELTITPDIGPLNIINGVAIVNQPETNQLIYIQPQPPIIVPDNTGVHFLSNFSTSEVVDLTSTDEPPEQPRVVKNKRKCTKNYKSSSSPTKKKCPQVPVVVNIPKTMSQKPSVKKVTNDTVAKLRPKRSSTVSVDNGIKRSSLYKLGHHANSEGWKVLIPRIPLPEYQCPICLKFYCSQKSRQRHEKQHHSMPSISTVSKVNSVCSIEDTSNTEKQQEFLLYFKLIKKSEPMSNQMDSINRLIKRKHLLTSMETFGKETGTFACRFCEYKTRRMFILWAHVSANHGIKPQSDSRSNSFCFICDRVLNKRTQLLKHIDKCLIDQGASEETDCEGNYDVDKSKEEKDDLPKSLSAEKYVCDYCGTDVDSLSLLEQHLWDHGTS